MPQYVYLNGKIVPAAKAVLPVTDIAILRGYGVFDSMLAEGDYILHGEKHLARFFRSAKLTGIAVPYTKEQIAKSLKALLKKNGHTRSKLRIVLTGGETVNSGLEFKPKTGNLFAIAEAYPEPKSEPYEKGVNLMTVDHRRSNPEAKTTNYGEAVSLQPLRRKRGAFEILYTHDGNVYECSTSNFFIVKGRQLITAKNGMLKGIIREFVLSKARLLGLQPIERDLKISELWTADEAFSTGTYKGVVPVVSIDGKKIKLGKPGPVAKQLLGLYREYR